MTPILDYAGGSWPAAVGFVAELSSVADRKSKPL
jgi:hypothetical protein